MTCELISLNGNYNQIVVYIGDASDIDIDTEVTEINRILIRKYSIPYHVIKEQILSGKGYDMYKKVAEVITDLTNKLPSFVY